MKLAYADRSNHVWMQYTEIRILACFCKCVAECLPGNQQWVKVWRRVKLAIWCSIFSWCGSVWLCVIICPCYCSTDADLNWIGWKSINSQTWRAGDDGDWDRGSLILLLQLWWLLPGGIGIAEVVGSTPTRSVFSCYRTTALNWAYFG